MFDLNRHLEVRSEQVKSAGISSRSTAECSISERRVFGGPVDAHEPIAHHFYMQLHSVSILWT
jgi:hypothetical protein